MTLKEAIASGRKYRRSHPGFGPHYGIVFNDTSNDRLVFKYHGDHGETTMPLVLADIISDDWELEPEEKEEIVTNYKIGEKVICYISDYQLAQYEQQSRFIGTLVRPMPPVQKHLFWKVELEGTGSQDTEGHNMIVTVHEKALRKFK